MKYKVGFFSFVLLLVVTSTTAQEQGVFDIEDTISYGHDSVSIPGYDRPDRLLITFDLEYLVNNDGSTDFLQYELVDIHMDINYRTNRFATPNNFKVDITIGMSSYVLAQGFALSALFHNISIEGILFEDGSIIELDFPRGISSEILVYPGYDAVIKSSFIIERPVGSVFETILVAIPIILMLGFLSILFGSDINKSIWKKSYNPKKKHLPKSYKVSPKTKKIRYEDLSECCKMTASLRRAYCGVCGLAISNKIFKEIHGE